MSKKAKAVGTIFQNRLIASNFLNGLILWYAVEKLFLSSIGVSLGQVGIVTSFLFLSILIFDIPYSIRYPG